VRPAAGQVAKEAPRAVGRGSGVDEVTSRPSRASATVEVRDRRRIALAWTAFVTAIARTRVKPEAEGELGARALIRNLSRRARRVRVQASRGGRLDERLRPAPRGSPEEFEHEAPDPLPRRQRGRGGQARPRARSRGRAPATRPRIAVRPGQRLELLTRASGLDDRGPRSRERDGFATRRSGASPLTRASEPAPTAELALESPLEGRKASRLLTVGASRLVTGRSPPR